MELNFCHVDMDAFYASIEERDNPSLKGKPLVVGGRSNRGIITTANYEARKFGLHSAMPIFQAKKLCPNVIVVPIRRDVYIKESERIFNILSKYSPIIEKLSIDEGYLDLSGNTMDRLKLAQIIKGDVLAHTGLTISVGISYNKFLAKLASDWNKPDGIKIIDEIDAKEILIDLPIGKVFGVGKKTLQKLSYLGIHTIRDMLPLSEDYLYGEFGKFGLILYDRIRGIDHREIEENIDRKSLGIERTLEKNIFDREEISEMLISFSKELQEDLIKKQFLTKTIVLKLKDEDFKTITRSYSLDNYTNSLDDIKRIALHLFNEVLLIKPIRLVGLTLANLIKDDVEQKSMFNY